MPSNNLFNLRSSEFSQPTAGFRPRCVGAAVGSRIFYVQGRNGDLVSRSGFSAAKFQNELCHSVSRSYFPPSPFIAGVVLRGGQGHFIALLNDEAGRMTVVDPLKGKFVVTSEQLKAKYRFSGLFLVVRRG